MMTDNLGYGDLGIYGGLRAPTPRIDRLAREGVQLRDFQVEPAALPPARRSSPGAWPSAPEMTPSRSRARRADCIRSEVTLAEMLKGAGYKTAMYGKWHVGEMPERQPQMQGFDEFWGILSTSLPTDPTDPDIQTMGVPMQQILAAKAGAKAEQVGQMTLEYRGLIDREITDKAVAYIKANSKGERTVLSLCPIYQSAPSGGCPPRFQRQVGWRHV